MWPGTDGALAARPAVRAGHRRPRGRGVRRRARDRVRALAGAGARRGRRAARPAGRRPGHPRVGRVSVWHAGGAHRRAGARVGAPPARHARPRPLGAAHLGWGGAGAPDDRPPAGDGGLRAPRRLDRRARVERAPRAAHGRHPGAEGLGLQRDPRQRLGARPARGSRRRLPEDRRGVRVWRQLRGAGRRRGAQSEGDAGPELSASATTSRLTETAKQCDVVLPATHWLERDDIVFPWADFLLYSHKVAEPPAQTRHDYDIFADVAERLGFGAEFTEGKDEAAWLDEFLAASEVPDAEEFRRTGIYVSPERERVGLAEFAADPAGHPLSTPSGMVELAGAACVAAGLSEAPEARLLPADQARPLRLVTPKSRVRIHSQLAELPSFRARDDRSLWLNPADAAARALADGDAVLVESAQGRVRCACRVTEDVMPGVVSLLAGLSPAFGAGRRRCGRVRQRAHLERADAAEPRLPAALDLGGGERRRAPLNRARSRPRPLFCLRLGGMVGQDRCVVRAGGGRRPWCACRVVLSGVGCRSPPSGRSGLEHRLSCLRRYLSGRLPLLPLLRHGPRRPSLRSGGAQGRHSPVLRSRRLHVAVRAPRSRGDRRLPLRLQRAGEQGRRRVRRGGGEIHRGCRGRRLRLPSGT